MNPPCEILRTAVLLGSFVLAAPLAGSAWAQGGKLRAFDPRSTSRVIEVLPFERPLSYARARAAARDVPGRVASARFAPEGGGGTTSKRIPLADGSEADMPRDLALTPDGATLVVVARDTCTVEFHDAASGARLGRVQTGKGPVDVALTPDGQMALVACAEDDTLRVIDVAARRELRAIRMPTASPFRVEVTPDGNRAVVAMIGTGLIGRLALVDLASCTIVRTRSTPGLAPIGRQLAPGYGTFALIYADLELSADGSMLAVADYFGRSVRLLDTPTLDERAVLDTSPHFPSSVDLSSSGTAGVVSMMSAAFSVPDAVGAFDLAGSALRSFPVVGGPSFLAEVRITPDDTRALVGTSAGSELIDLTTGAITLLNAGDAWGAIEFSRDGSRAILSSPRDTSIVDLASAAVLARIPDFLVKPLIVDDNQRAFGLSFLIDEDLRALSTDPATAGLLWRNPIGEPVEIDGPYSVDATADGSRAIVTCTISKNVVLVDLHASEIVATVPTVGAAYAVAASPVEDLALVMQSEDGSIAVLDTAHGRMLTEVAVSGTPARVQVAPGGRRGFVLSREGDHGYVSVLDVGGGVRGSATALAGEVLVPHGGLSSMAHTSDGGIVAVGNLLPSVLTLIDAVGLTLLAEVPVATFPLELAFTPDGSRLLATSSDRVLSVLELEGGSILELEVDLPGKAVTLNVGPDGLHAYMVALVPAFRGVKLQLLAVDLETYELVAEEPLAFSPGNLITLFPFLTEAHGDELVFAQTEIQRIWRFRLAGPDTELLEEHPIGPFSYGFSYSPSRRTALIPLSVLGDELELVGFAPLP